ncbi:SEL1-like repeat protein [Asticcacaulis sp. BYS171W]|uniref:SEL1-like repeat protein n=1 Tax=Asticcacaulis aquaticus TaxID=2984212 RepID=A0ABT5HR26_9CAUL|nr:SEL1-like repeat protein [Asticcacaulis aquaticus]MDC7682403.1 SEL1-like repeat protein [Asticcacaulis aquaticus]
MNSNTALAIVLLTTAMACTAEAQTQSSRDFQDTYGTASGTQDYRARRDAEKAVALPQVDTDVAEAIRKKDYPYLLKRYDKDCSKAVATGAKSKNLPERATRLNRTPQALRSCHDLADMYRKGLGVPADIVKATELYTQSMYLGVSTSQDVLIGMAPDPQARIALITSMATNPRLGVDNRCLATRLLAELYVKGDGVAKDLHEAMKWHRLCYDSAGDLIDTVMPDFVLTGALRLIDLYTLPDPQLRNLPEALTIAERVIASKGTVETRGLAQARYQAGRLLYNGEAGPKDQKRGVDLLEKAGGAGHVDAMLLVAEIYDRGEGVVMDKARAALWLDDAVSARNPRALYLKGQKVHAANDRIGAKTLWLDAAREGHVEAQYALGQYFLNDTAKTPNDQANAYVWLDVAARNGHPQAGAARDALKSQLPPELLKAAEGAEVNLLKAYPKIIG